jgi:two-component sensor histidine kinase
MFAAWASLPWQCFHWNCGRFVRFRTEQNVEKLNRSSSPAPARSGAAALYESGVSSRITRASVRAWSQLRRPSSKLGANEPVGPKLPFAAQPKIRGRLYDIGPTFLAEVAKPTLAPASRLPMLGSQAMQDGGHCMSSLDLQVGAQSNEEHRQAQEERYAKLMRAIAWLDALRKTAIPDVVAAQRSRFTDELRQIALRRQRMVDIHVDVTERKRLEEHKNLLIRELDHRFKNMLSVISVIASRTLETSSSMTAFVTALDGRIKALMTTHELLSRRSWHGISLAELVHQELAPYATANNTEIKGSHDILSANAGQVIGMVLHELAANAAKYGALSNKDGRVWVCWRQQPNGQGENQSRLEWKERGGPLVVPQSRWGYGSSVIRDLIPYELGGTVELIHSREGVCCNLEIPAHWIADSKPRSQTVYLESRLCDDCRNNDTPAPVGIL